MRKQIAKITARQVARKCASKQYISAVVGKAKVSVKGKYSNAKVISLVETLDKYNPDSDTVKFKVSAKGISVHIGKHITIKRVFFISMAVVAGGAGAWYVSKYIYTRATKSLEKASKDEEEPKLVSYNLPDLKNSDKNITPMIGKMLPENFDCLVYGEKGCMKSFLVLGTMIQLGLGEVPQILPTDKRETYTPVSNVRCIYVDGENGQFILNDRYNNILDKLGFLDVIEAQSFGNGGDKLFQAIREVCKKYPDGTKIVLGIDNMKSVANDLSSSSGKELLNNLKKLRAELYKRHISLTSMIIHHTEKSGKEASGSYTFPCLIPFVFKLEYNAQNKERVLVVEESRTYPKGDRYLLKEVQGDYLYLRNDHLIESAVKPVETPKEDVESDVETPSWNEKIPLNVMEDIMKFYEVGVSGKGLKTTIAKFKLEQYGITDSTQLTRLIKKWIAYQEF